VTVAANHSTLSDRVTRPLDTASATFESDPWHVQAARALLVLLAATLPFEVKTPLFPLGPVVVTNTELLLYAVIGLWGFGRMAVRRTRFTALSLPILAVMAVFVVSAIATTEGRGDALKFAARSAGGCLLALAAIDLIATARQTRAILAALVLGSVVSAVTGILEVEVPTVQRWLTWFKTQPTFASGFLRASGTFQYANTAAMYWEASLPLLVGLALTSRFVAPGRGLWLPLGAVAVVSTALVASASRAGLIGAALTLLLVAWVGGQKGPAIRKLAAASLLLLLAVFVAHGLRTGLLALRLWSTDTSKWHRAVWLDTPRDVEAEQGTLIRVPLRVRNDGVLSWTSRGYQPVHLSYHWLHQRGGYAVFDGARTPLPRDVAPGEEVLIEAYVFVNVAPGQHQLQWDLVREGVTWFSAEGGPVSNTAASVRRSTTPHLPPPDLRRLTPRPEFRPPRLVLWRAAWRMWVEHPLTGIGPDNFRHLYGGYANLRTFDDRITANSFYFEVLATLGLLGVAAWSWLIVHRIALARRWWQASGPGLQAGMSIGVGGALMAFMLHGSVDYFLEFTPTYGLFWLLVGIASRTWAMPARESTA
jgi:hypothetical protein